MSLVACACSEGGAGNGTVATPLCDGQSMLRFRAALGPLSAQEVPGGEFRVQHGHWALAVDGKCDYWVNAGWTEDMFPADREWRTGHLTDAQSVALAKALPLNGLAPLDDCPGPPAGVDHPTLRQLLSAQSGAYCASQGKRFDAAWGFVEGLGKELWNMGTPLTGPVRLAARWVENFGQPPYAWPLRRPLPEVIAEYNIKGPFIIREADEVIALRRLRDGFNSDRQSRQFLWAGLNVQDASTAASIFMRDALPYENELGEWPF
jgi:hypothetical protein